jgi:hypothetical protein
MKAKLTVEDTDYPVTIHDISLSGALVKRESITPSLKAQLGTLEFLLDDNETDVTMHVAIVHEQDDEMGLQCNGIDIDSISHLRRLVELNLGDDSQLHKELSQLSYSKT